MGAGSWFWCDWWPLWKQHGGGSLSLIFIGFARRFGDRPPNITVALLGLHVEIPLGARHD